MSLVNAVVLTGTTVSATGGTNVTFAPDGVTVANGLHLVVPADTYDVRRQLTCKVKTPVVNAKLGTYSRDKKSMTLVIPQVNADGSVGYNVLRIERELYPDVTDAAALDLCKIGAQLLTDADFTNFWAYGSLV